MRQAGERVRIEGERRSCQHTGGDIAGPSIHESEPGKGGQREPGDHHQVHHEDRRTTGPCDRRAEQCRDDERFGKSEGVAGRKKDVGVEQSTRRARQLVRHPGHDPLVQLGVIVVVPREPPRRSGQRPRVNYRKHGAQQGGAQPWCPPRHRLWRGCGCRYQGQHYGKGGVLSAHSDWHPPCND